MKALVTIAFAVEIEEDDLTELARTLDESIYDAIKERFDEKRINDVIEQGEIEKRFDWYGATISIRRPVFEGMVESE